MRSRILLLSLVVVTEVVKAIGGPGGGSGFRVTSIDLAPIDAPADPLVDDIDARWTGEIVMAGSSTIIDVHIAFRRNGCSSPGSLSHADDTIAVQG